jgi:plastocyanin
VRRALGVCGVLLAAALVTAAPADADLVTVTHRQGPFKLDPYQVRYTSKKTREVEAPHLDGFVVGMSARVVDRSGRPIPVQRIMLHHIVYKDAGSRPGERRDPVCGSQAESFYGSGEENVPLRLPPNYGYRIRKGDRWWTGWMLMNHKNRTGTAYIEYTAVIDTSPNLAHVTPYWLRTTGCETARDPIFTVPGGGAPGSRYRISSDFSLPRPGLLIAAGAHAHGGDFDMTLSQPDCGDRPLFTSRPTWGLPSHPYYNVRPVLHEPGPINMTWSQTGLGIPLGAGEPLRVSADYDAEFPHVRAMGIMHIYVHHKPDVQASCDPLPDDIQSIGTDTPGRAEPPRIQVPLTGLDADGRPVTISRPPGPMRRFAGGATVKVRDFSFSLRNISIPAGARVRYRFFDRESHNVSLANGPLGFASRNLHRGATYSRRFTKPGVYRSFCTLHPIDMTQAIVVRKR